MEIRVKIITAVLIFTMVSFLMKFLKSRADKEGATLKEDGKQVLKYSGIYAVVGWFSSIVSIVVLIIGSINIGKLNSDYFLLSVVFLILFLSGLFLILASKNMRMEFDSKGIKSVGFNGKENFIEWSKIEKITFSKVSCDLKFISGKKVVKVNFYMSGFNSIIESIKVNVDKLIYSKALSEVELVKNRIGK